MSALAADDRRPVTELGDLLGALPREETTKARPAEHAVDIEAMLAAVERHLHGDRPRPSGS